MTLSSTPVAELPEGPDENRPSGVSSHFANRHAYAIVFWRTGKGNSPARQGRKKDPPGCRLRADL